MSDDAQPRTYTETLVHRVARPARLLASDYRLGRNIGASPILDESEPFWNQEFQWADIPRVCFKDEGVFASDILLLEVNGQQRPICILTEARRGPEFVGQLVGRGLFPWDVAKKALTSTNGGMICWPPRER